MRGKLANENADLSGLGITPAGAGKTWLSTFGRNCGKDHPRRCGENLTLYLEDGYIEGSPPQVRGKPLFSALGGNNSRITPAGAGKTSVAIGTGVCNRDHPRRCGENTMSA